MKFTPLTQIEGRVLGTLIEKENVIPYAYPLTLKRCQTGCNQSDNRKPRLHLLESDLQEALDSLISFKLVESIQSRHTMLYRHIIGDTLKIPSQAVPIIGMLLLNGAMTVSDIKYYGDRFFNLPSASVIQSYLESLTEKVRHESLVPLTMLLPRRDMERKPRWIQLLTGRIIVPPKEPLTVENMQKLVVDLETRLNFLEERLGVKKKF